MVFSPQMAVSCENPNARSKRVLRRISTGVCLLFLAFPLSLHAVGNTVAPNGTSGSAPYKEYRDVLKSLPELLKNDPERMKQMECILQNAQRARNLPVYERATSLEELRNPGTRRIAPLDKAANAVEKINAEKAHIFAIAQSDSELMLRVGNELPLLAAGYAITGDKSYLDRVIAQLREIVTWDPLQRPGWSLFDGKANLPPDGNDGVWLATGEGLAAIWKTLDILPGGSLPPDLINALREQLKRESKRVTRDWKNKVMWFVKGNRITSNQWIEPAAGQALACAMLGNDADPADRELAVTNLLSSVNALGSDGSASEGFGYVSGRSAPMLFAAAQALAKAGDTRLASHPFFKKFPAWMAMQCQPGQWLVNFFDCYGATRGNYHQKAADFARIFVLSQDPYLGWVFRNVIKTLPYDNYGLVSLVIRDSELKQPPAWGLYEQSHSAIWRSSWAENASGVWVRGKHMRDSHDHCDRGHVNFIAGGKAVLIEAGTPGYDDPLKAERFDSVVGHNVLQVDDDYYPKKLPAPITVNRMDGAGGDLIVEAGAGYPTVKSWQRHVTWTAKRMEITDEVTLATPGKVTFRWHLGSEKPLEIKSQAETAAVATLPPGEIVFKNPPQTKEPANSWTPPPMESMETPWARIEVQADQPIVCTDEKNMDHAIRYRNQHHLHTTLIVRSANPVGSIRIKTVVETDPAASR